MGRTVRSLGRDEMPCGKQAKKVAIDVIHYASYIWLQVYRMNAGSTPSPVTPAGTAEQYLVVHCRNGRTRSPTVVFIFFMLFCFDSMRKKAQAENKLIGVYLSEQFQAQRPHVPARASGGQVFPNLTRIATVVAQQIFKALQTGDPWLEKAARGPFEAYNLYAQQQTQERQAVEAESYVTGGRAESFTTVDPKLATDVLAMYTNALQQRDDLQGPLHQLGRELTEEWAYFEPGAGNYRL